MKCLYILVSQLLIRLCLLSHFKFIRKLYLIKSELLQQFRKNSSQYVHIASYKAKKLTIQTMKTTTVNTQLLHTQIKLLFFTLISLPWTLKLNSQNCLLTIWDPSINYYPIVKVLEFLSTAVIYNRLF